MAVKRPKRNSRFDTVKALYGMVIAGYATEEQAKNQFTYGNIVLFKSELSKFVEENADIDAVAFEQFLVNTGALKTSGKRSDGTGSKASSLASDEKIIALGILADNVGAYKSALTTLQSAKAVINGLIVNKEFTCGYYITKHGKKAQ